MLLAIIIVWFFVFASTKQECLNNCNLFVNTYLDALKFRNYEETLPHLIHSRATNKTKNATCPYMHETQSSPYIAIILRKTSGQFLCLGSILDSETILTAKSCFEGKNGNDANDDNNYYVLAGYLKSYWGRNSQVARVDTIIKGDGLAILRLKRHLEVNKTVKKVKLPNSNFTAMLPSRDIGCEVGIYGFPVNKWDMPGEALPKSMTYTLKSAKVVATADCDKIYKDKLPPGTKTDSNTCLQGETNFCWGAMGSPVIAKHDKLGLIQLGVIGMANCNDQKDYPMLNVGLAHELTWIKSNLNDKYK